MKIRFQTKDGIEEVKDCPYVGKPLAVVVTAILPPLLTNKFIEYRYYDFRGEVRDGIPTVHEHNMKFPKPRHTKLTDTSPCPIRGKHYGRPMESVPAKYLDWFLGQKFLITQYPEVVDYIARNIKAINKELEEEGEE